MNPDLPQAMHGEKPVKPWFLLPRSSWADGSGTTIEKNLPDTVDERPGCGCALDEGAVDAFDGGLCVYPSDGALIRFVMEASLRKEKAP
ncbi:hypothetical protein JR065_03840 [Xanthomonas sp. AmX2]|uniref:hypothetical protein n=1 Tax=Xanthomonas sp. TaxID=29446 RepID=UPI00197EDA21|nr:hypothetical protein [Xanthomonas sp.]MBN6149458.1 hypothetical protein [Xanthomonas sp.]